jgi:class 3 adenylate cyclase
VLDERISSLERKAEEESNYAETLSKKFGRRSYFDLLKDELLGAFTPAELDFLSGRDSITYIVFSERIQTELKKGLKSMKSLLSEGEKKYLTTQLDEFIQTLNSIFDEGVKAGISPVLIEFALKRYLKIQIPSKKAIPIHKKVSLSLQFFTKRELRKKSIKKSLVRFTEKSLLIPVSLSEVKLEDFSDFIEAGSFFCDVTRIFADCYITPVRIETSKIDYTDIREKMKTTRDLIKENASRKLKDVFNEVDDLGVKEIRGHLSEIVKYINSGEAKARALNSQLLRLKDIAEVEEKVNVPGILRFFDPNLGDKIRENINRSKVTLNEKLSSTPESFLSRSLLGRKTDLESVIDWFIKNYDEFFLPTIIELIFEDMVKVFPETESESLEEARWIGLLARKSDPPAVYFIPEIDRTLSRGESIVKDCSKVVSVMVYDIRGSSIMGKKLLNAEMEDRIRNEFQVELLKAVEDTSGFFVKDTGDGGIVLFSEESSDFNFSQISIPGGEIKELQDREISLKASPDAASRAVRCARKMIDYSERFVRKNLKRYQEWFKDFDVKGIDFGGITYERLPPEYKKIFQIGIGIASGKPGEDIYLGRNVLGRLDLTGNLIRRANMYSTVHHPDRSVILIGASTMFSFVLNVGSFEPVGGEEKIEKSSYLSMQKKLIDEVVLWMKGLSGNYVVSDYKVSLQRIDYLLDNLGERETIKLPEESVSVKKGVQFFDSKVREERVLYEVIPEKRG